MNVQKKPLYRIRLTLLILVLSFNIANAVEFNIDVLDIKDRDNVDLSKFTNKDYVMPGKYLLNVYLNNQSISNEEKTIPFYSDDRDATIVNICFPAPLVSHLGLTKESLDKVIFWHQNECADFSALAGLTLKGDINNGFLYVSSPQTYLEYTDSNWLPPSSWDNGINGFLLDYYLNTNTSKTYQGESQTNTSLSGTTGLNFGAWRLRGNYQGMYNASSQRKQHNFSWSRLYAYRSLPYVNSIFTLGENYFSSDLFDSFRYLGMSLMSDERMLPPNLRGYAPEVSGIAKTNAAVTVSQKGRVIYETTVAPGPFRLRGLNSSVSGKLEVNVKEQDGTTQTFFVDTANVPYLTRPGSIRYKLAVGRPSNYQHHVNGSIFTSGEFSWGVANSWSLYGGGVVTDDFQSYAVGLGRDLFVVGAISADITQSYAKLPRQDQKTGKSYRLSYSKRFDDYDSEVTFAGYRFAERDFMSMGQFLDARSGYHNLGRSKEMYTITASKNFTDAQMSMYTTYTHQSYWDRPIEESYRLTLNRYFDFMQLKNLSVNVSISRNQYEKYKNDNVYINLSVPLGEGRYIGYSGQSSGSTINQTINYTDHIDINNDYRIAAGTNSHGQRDTNAVINGYYTHRNELAEISINAGYSQNDYSSIGGTVQGGITATTKGIALHPSTSNGGTRLMVSTEGIANVPINGGITRSNALGIAVLTNINSYYRTNTNIDINQIADDIEVKKGVVDSSLTEGAIGYREFKLLQGIKTFAFIQLSDGAFPPFGASVINSKGNELAIVTDNGHTYISGFSYDEKLNVNWNGKNQCQIHMPSELKFSDNLLLPCKTLN
ncbi:fimbria/pilus outer membrane usher protein [Providencia rettgeri]|uniref:fimbria/pilus outer membrane usher protein n=1 Tax=Providencia rettgeri TaxID=587 RepID=UPI00029C1611|nr:fimbria/pilus outer membrane usher protein [Providencia rettgeri]EKT57788.1 fimbrial usher protein [Providencia rettgeri Dmel1]